MPQSYPSQNSLGRLRPMRCMSSPLKAWSNTWEMFIYLVTPVVRNTETGFNFHWYCQGHPNTSLHVAEALHTSLEARRTSLKGVRRGVCSRHNLLAAWLF